MASDNSTTGDDGIHARVNGAWAKEKLSFLADYVPIALEATAKKRDRWYIDLFAGPGRNVDPESGENFAGSPLIAIPSVAPRSGVSFTNAVIVNKDRNDHLAVRKRLERLRDSGKSPLPGGRIEYMNENANAVIPAIMRRIDHRAYALVVADITAPSQLPWESVKRLKSQGHQSVDLYMLFPLHMGLNRMLGYDTATEAAVDRFFGTEKWRPIYAARQTDRQSAEMRRQLLDLYLEQLRTEGRWKYAFEVRDVKRTGNAALYRMLFASENEAGARLGRWAVKPRNSPGGQTELF